MKTYQRVGSSFTGIRPSNNNRNDPFGSIFSGIENKINIDAGRQLVGAFADEADNMAPRRKR